MNLVPQFGFLELILIAVIALIVVGPRDLPKLMRMAGKMVGKARRMAGEFTSAFDEMSRETEMEEMRKEIEALKSANPISQVKRELNETMAPIQKDIREESRQLHEAAQGAGASTEPAPSPEKAAE